MLEDKEVDKEEKDLMSKLLIGSGAGLANHVEAWSLLWKQLSSQNPHLRQVLRKVFLMSDSKFSFNPDVKNIVFDSLKEKNNFICNIAVHTLKLFRGQITGHPLQALMEALNNPYDDSRLAGMNAVRALGPDLIKYSDILKKILAAVKNVEAKEECLLAMEACLAAGSSMGGVQEIWEILLKVSTSPDTEIRAAGIRLVKALMGQFIADPILIDKIILLMQSQDFTIRKYVLNFLLILESYLSDIPKILTALIDSAGDSYREIRNLAKKMLKSTLVKGLDSHPRLYNCIIEALAKGSARREVMREIIREMPLKNLIEGYLETEKEHAQTWLGVFSNNPWFPFLYYTIFSQEWPSIALDLTNIIVIAGTQNIIIPLGTSKFGNSLAEGLIDYLVDLKSRNFHFFSFLSTGKEKEKWLYPEMKKPAFKLPKNKFSTNLFLSSKSFSVVPAIESSSLKEKKKADSPSNYLSSSGLITLSFAVCYSDIRQGKVLGKGASGEVKLCRYNFEEVAVKFYQHSGVSASDLEKIQQEASFMIQINSDHLVRLKGICMESPNYCVLMEYLPKGDLYSLLQSKNSLTWPQRYRLAMDIAIGLHHLHEARILHRDLKSLNILLDVRNGELRAKLSDFGLSTLKELSLHSRDEVVGTLPWLAPEIIKKTSEYTKASDIYSLGLVFYELATGKPPYHDLPLKPARPSRKDIYNWIVDGERPWKYLPSECPLEFQQLIKMCCHEEPAKRLAANVIVNRIEAFENDPSLMHESKKMVDEQMTHSGAETFSPAQAGVETTQTSSISSSTAISEKTTSSLKASTTTAPHSVIFNQASSSSATPTSNNSISFGSAPLSAPP